MIKFPKKSKYAKQRKGRIKGFETKNSLVNLVFGKYGIKITKNGRLSGKQLEAMRKVIVKQTGRRGQLWIRTLPNYIITSKPNESRMGKGKGAFFDWVFRAKAGTILLEIEGCSETIAKKILKLVSAKIALGLRLVVT